MKDEVIDLGELEFGNTMYLGGPARRGYDSDGSDELRLNVRPGKWSVFATMTPFKHRDGEVRYVTKEIDLWHEDSEKPEKSHMWWFRDGMKTKGVYCASPGKDFMSDLELIRKIVDAEKFRAKIIDNVVACGIVKSREYKLTVMTYGARANAQDNTQVKLDFVF